MKKNVLLILITCFSILKVDAQLVEVDKKEEISVVKIVKKTNMQAPSLEKIPKEIKIHGTSRIDNYYWLNEKENPKVIEYLNKENTYREESMAQSKELQQKLFEEIKGRIKQNDNSVPYFKNGYWYYVKFEEGLEYPFYCRKKGNLKNPEEVFFNVNEMASGSDYYDLGSFEVSHNNQIIAFTVDTISRRQYKIYFKNLVSNSIIDPKIKNASGAGMAWSANDLSLYYTKKDPETLREYAIFKHKYLSDGFKDELIFEEKEEAFYTSVYSSKIGKHIIIASTSTVSSEYRIQESKNDNDNFKVFQKRERDLEYSIVEIKDKFFVLTNWKAKNFRLMECPINATSKENWKEVIPHNPQVFLEEIDEFENHLVIEERENGLTKMRIIDLKKKESHWLNFGEETYSASLSENQYFEDTVFRYNYSSLTTPNSVIEYNFNSKEKSILKEQEIVGGYNKNLFETKRIMVKSHDNKEIPMSIVYKKGIQFNSNNPCLLYGYGSYGYSIEDAFSSVRLSLLERGFIFAIAHVRGGQEMGRDWYEDGKLLKKKNSFLDFISCAEALIELKYTSTNGLFAMGGSAGGLLMGAVLNMRPDLWKGVIAAVPFVDVITTMLDETIPLTTGEFDEWGNPKEKKYYDYILSYSPYDNIERKNYPAILITTGLHDSQVQYFEPAKWIAKLREYKTDNNPLYMYCNMETGHGGASGRFEKYKEVAMEYAFLISALDNLGGWQPPRLSK